jgi:hypothetical protein
VKGKTGEQQSDLLRVPRYGKIRERLQAHAESQLHERFLDRQALDPRPAGQSCGLGAPEDGTYARVHRRDAGIQMAVFENSKDVEGQTPKKNPEARISLVL